MAIQLQFRGTENAVVDLSKLSEAFTKSPDLESLKRTLVPVGNRMEAFGELFQISGNFSDSSQHWSGNMRNVDGLGACHSDGELFVEGDVGNRFASRMHGGTVRIHGNVGHGAGAAMAGGILAINGNAGDRIGAAETPSGRGMNRGTIIVNGSVGDLAGFRMRRGNLLVSRMAKLGGFQMLAGTICSQEPLLTDAGDEMRRGTIVTLATQARDEFPKSSRRFSYSGEFRLLGIKVWLAFMINLLESTSLHQKGFEEWHEALAKAQDSIWTLLHGDRTVLNKGEILLRAG
ncbi:MAG: formylmethanofuran dehydrogenase subunit C [Pirellulaceae bacterium]